GGARAGGGPRGAAVRGLRHEHLGAVTQPVAAFGHHDVAGRESGGDRGALAVDHAEGDRLHRHRTVGRYGVDERRDDAVRSPAAYRRIWDDDLLREDLLEELHVHELVREERAVGVVEQRAQLDGARGDVDLIVEGEKLPLSEPRAVGPIEGVYLERAAAAQLPRERGDVILGDRKDDADRLHLIDHDDAVRIAGRHIVTLVDLAKPHAAVDGRDD